VTALLYAPCISFLAEWFVLRRGLANGVIFAGTAIGGTFFPLVLPHLIGSYGTSITLRILAVAFLLFVGALVPFLKGRLPMVNVAHGPRPKGTHRKLFNVRFALVMVVNTLQSLGYFVPIVWLPSQSVYPSIEAPLITSVAFAAEMNIERNKASLALSLLYGKTCIVVFCADSLKAKSFFRHFNTEQTCPGSSF
jgi:MFS transporter, MCT family, solute carrier family 16 (monocarboxylic acid transporters), member 10